MLSIREPVMEMLMEMRAGRAQIQAINRTKVHRLHPARDLGEAGKDEDDKAEEEELDRTLESSKLRVQAKDKAKVQDKDKDR